MLTEPMVVGSELLGREAALDLSQDASNDDVQGLAKLRDVYTAIIEIQARTNVQLEIPDPIGGDNAAATLNIAELARHGRATGHIDLKTNMNVDPQHAFALANRLAATRQIVTDFEHELMGRVVRLGWARFTFQQLTARAVSAPPGGLATIRLEAAGEIDIKLIDEPLPSDVALDIRTGPQREAGTHP